MSGIYISGMEMPKSDHPLWVVIHKDGTVEYNEWNEWKTAVGKAAPVPPHGRLIDESEIPWCVDWYAGRKRYYTTPKTVEHLPTIIPVDPDKGGNRMSLGNFKEDLKVLMDMVALKLSVEEYEALIEWAKEQGWGF